MKNIFIIFVIYCSCIFTSCTTVVPANLSHIDEVVGDSKKVILVIVIRTYKDTNKDDDVLYIYAKTDGIPILIVANQLEYRRDRVCMRTMKYIDKKKYIFVLKQTHLNDIKQICEDLKIPHLSDQIKCYKTSNVEGVYKIVNYVSLYDFEDLE